MKLYGLIGHPLGHSFSKAYFTKKFEEEGLGCRYENFDLENIGLVIQLIKEHPGLKGFNVTIPYKEAIIPYLDEMDGIAAEIHAVNTVKVLDDGRLMGFNTDVIGFEDLFCHVRNVGNRALILGTGGASKAVQHVLKSQNINYRIISRDPQKGDYTYKELRIEGYTYIINATPVGTFPKVDEAPMIPYEAITPQHVLIDLVYNPEETLFLQKGKAQGATVVNGLSMLHAQAKASWKIWEREAQ